MELIIRKKPDRFKCSGCTNTTDNTKIVSMDEYDSRAGYYCPDCLLKAYLLINPIQFDKDFIAEHIDKLFEFDMQNKNYDDIDKFIEFVRHFLESK